MAHDWEMRYCTLLFSHPVKVRHRVIRCALSAELCIVEMCRIVPGTCSWVFASFRSTPSWMQGHFCAPHNQGFCESAVECPCLFQLLYNRTRCMTFTTLLIFFSTPVDCRYSALRSRLLPPISIDTKQKTDSRTNTFYTFHSIINSSS